MRVVQFLLLCAAAACISARTASTQEPVTAHITSLSDKDIRNKAKVHPAFANAGRQAGIEIWRIEDFEPVPIAVNDYGMFYRGDSYIVLKTKADERNNLSWDIFYWIGSESTQDESGAAAILTIGLDDKFDGAAVQHRVMMGDESQLFLSGFPSGVYFPNGGHKSGFNHVETNAGAEKRFFHIKGKKNVRVRQIDPVIASMNDGDCFILDLNHTIYIYVGDKAKNAERIKAISFANQIRDQDHHGRGKVEIIDQYSTEAEVQEFFTALGFGAKNLVPEESAGGDDYIFEWNQEHLLEMYEVSNCIGKLKVTSLPKPYRQEQLNPQDAYILDTIGGNIFVWVGKQSNEIEQNAAMAKAEQFLMDKAYPSWVHVMRIPQGTEPAVFKQYFPTWRDMDMSYTRIV